MEKPKKRSWFGKLSLILMSTAVTLLVIEIILRVFFPVYQTSILEAYQYDEELGVRLRPNIHLFEMTDFQEEVRTNQFGTVNFQENWDAYDSIIFTVGDSYTQGTGLPSDMSYPAQLDILLNKDAGGFYLQKYGVVNLGLAAFGGEQSLIALRRWSSLIRRPQFILYLGCDNDYEDDILFKSGYRHNHLVHGNPNWGWLVGPLQWLTNDLQIGIRLKLLIGGLRRARLNASNSGTEPAGPSVAALERPVIENIAAFAKENNARLIVGWSGEGASYEWLKGWAAENEVLFADWGPKVGSVRANVPELPLENHHSGGHLRGWVNQIIAEEYARQIREAK